MCSFFLSFFFFFYLICAYQEPGYISALTILPISLTHKRKIGSPSRQYSHSRESLPGLHFFSFVLSNFVSFLFRRNFFFCCLLLWELPRLDGPIHLNNNETMIQKIKENNKKRKKKKIQTIDINTISGPRLWAKHTVRLLTKRNGRLTAMRSVDCLVCSP